jgi:hypothetical protein
MRPAKFIEVKIYVKITKKKKITRFSPDISKTARGPVPVKTACTCPLPSIVEGVLLHAHE